ncbi:MAG: methylated-DNA--[protein]-cysteine S-methyltransferase [Deltaproteobacteria bacterium]|nr:methylated-DNA--[protein]-cysteine S-methyltransferase [Deltaproteobacteria bacterium]MBW2418322.1 methylated-DNA--[protein]-cysteine S-methyltransferase [Deltaproteobacteria bacterium]
MDTRDYERVARSLRYLAERSGEEPALDELAARVELSPYHFERLFKRWAGTTPKRFIQCLRVEHAKRLLRESRSVLDASFEAGLSSPSRLHDLFCTLEAVTPGEYKSGGQGLKIRYGVHATPFGSCFIAATERGICRLGFCDDPDDVERGDAADAALRDLEAEWPRAERVEDAAATRPVVERAFGARRLAGDRPLHLYVRGTNLQVQVWRALLAIPEGCLISYQDLACALDRPRAARAVASAVAANRVGVLIPCHRVLRGTGAITGYRWGPERKRALIAWESVRSAGTAGSD